MRQYAYWAEMHARDGECIAVLPDRTGYLKAREDAESGFDRYPAAMRATIYGCSNDEENNEESKPCGTITREDIADERRSA